jgi:2-amino-4-hydroxy-6-hydroxymethyldihydropteridine diphosphokinase
VIVYLALGSNLGDREEYLRSAVRGLVAHGIDVIQCASLYSTEPRDVIDQPWFLNTVVQATTNLTPEALLMVCLKIEQENDRKRDQLKGPRTLDIDILFYGNAVIYQPGLAIPHPRFAARKFVLAPIAEIAPDFTDPVYGKTMRQWLAECPDSATVTRVSDARAFCRPFPSAPQ